MSFNVIPEYREWWDSATYKYYPTLRVGQIWQVGFDQTDLVLNPLDATTIHKLRGLKNRNYNVDSVLQEWINDSAFVAQADMRLVNVQRWFLIYDPFVKECWSGTLFPI
jgi:hypothetical protein